MRSFAYSFTPTEEIVRWAFEVHINTSATAKKNWFIAFTNPTAGPWKRVMAPDSSGKNMVEVARFGREEERPDLLLVSDVLCLNLIIEAKDDLSKLVTEAQMKKSLAVIRDLGKRLTASTVEVWKARAAYRIIPGFLWGGAEPQSELALVTNAYDRYCRQSDGKSLVGICVIKTTDAGLKPVMLGRGDKTLDINQIALSFGLSTK